MMQTADLAEGNNIACGGKSWHRSVKLTQPLHFFTVPVDGMVPEGAARR
jgi:hypothetical protein